MTTTPSHSWLRRTLGASAAAWAILLGMAAARAQPAEVLSRDDIQRIDVSEDRLTDRPFRDQTWIPMNRDDFERLLSQILPKPPGPTQPAVRHIRYSAVLSGNTLAGGRLQATLQEVSGQSSLVNLGQPSLALDDLSWSQGPAVWGTSPDGRSWLQLAPEDRMLEGRWTARGRSLLSGVAFTLDLLPAAVSQLELQTPLGHLVTSDVGDVVPVEPDGDGSLLRWRIDLGNQSRCRLLVTRSEPARSVAPMILYEQDLAVTVSNEELVLRQVLLAEVLEGEVDRLTVSFPRQFEVVSVTYGDQSALSYEHVPGEGPTAQVVVRLPEKMQGRLRPIRVEGFLRRAASEPLVVPQFLLEGGLWLHGRVNVSVARPWELRSYRATGYRQSAPASLRTDAESISFQQLTPHAQLLLNVERPAAERTAHALNVLTVTDAIWTLTAEIAWESRSGTVFDAACRLPEGWQVVSVVQLGGDRELQELADWEVHAHPESGQLLHMEFSEGLTPGRVDPVRITAHRNPLAAPLTHVPVVLPADCESAEVLLLVDPRTGKNLPLPANRGFEPFDAHTAAAVWNTLPAWSEVLRGSLLAERLFHLTTTESAIPIPPEDVATLLDAAVQVSVTFDDRQVHEQFDLRLQLSESQREFTLYAPRGAAGIAWTMDAPAAQPVSARLSPRPPLATPDETWSLTWPQPVSGAVTLIGRRTVPREADYVVPLLLAPQARRFQGRILLSPDRAESFQLREIPFPGTSLGDRGQTPAENLSDIPREWNYVNGDREWLVQARQRPNAARHHVPFRLTSMLAIENGGDDYHQLHLASPSLAGLEELRFQLESPGEMISVLQAGQLLPFAVNGGEVTVTGWEPAAPGEITICYRVPAQARFCGRQHVFVCPRLSLPCEEFAWEICLPWGTDLYSAPLGMHFQPRPSRPGWFQRVFGPFSRTATEPWIVPLTHWRNTSSSTPQPAFRADPRSPWTQDLLVMENRPVYRAAQYGVPTASAFRVWDRHALRQATWTALLGCFPLGLLLRSRRGVWQNRMAATAIGALMCLAVFGPDGWNTVFGGGSTGWLLACLLPANVWSRLGRSPEATASLSVSTHVFHKTALPLMLWIALGEPLPRSVAQEPSQPADPVAGAAADRRPRYQVLVPVDRQQKPSQKLPVVYVSPALHEKLTAPDAGPPAEPVQLIESAEYIVHADTMRRPALKVKYRIHVLPGNETSELIVPLGRRWASGLESCTVDGQLQSAILSVDGRTLVLPREAASSGGNGDEAGRLVRHDVLLEIRLPQAPDAADADFEAEVLPVLSSRLTWRSPDALRWFDVPEARGEVTVSLDRRVVEAQLGGVDSIQFRRGKDDRSAQDDGTTEVQLLQLLMLHPQLTQGAFRAECRVLNGGPVRMDLELPVGAVLREIRGHKILRTTMQNKEGEAPVVVLEFQEPQRQNFVVEGEYILPRSSPSQNLDFPRCKVRCGRSTAAQRSLVAIACESGFSAQMINLDDPAVLPIPIEQFVSQWGDSVPNQLPRFAFQVQDGGQPSFRLAVVQSEQQLLNWREDVTLSSRKLDWQLTAELKSTSPSSFSYTVLLDRRLSVDQVSVRENGTDQLLRWSKTPMIGSSQNRLTLFLNRESAGTSQLRIHGSLRVRPSSSISLPSVRFEAVQSVPGTLTLYREPGHRLELEGRPVTAESNGSFPDLLTEPFPHRFSQRIKIPEGDSGLTVRLEPEAGACRVHSLWSITPASPQWTVRGRMELSPQGGVREIRVVLPDWLSAGQLTVPEGSPLPVEQSEEGRRMVSLGCDPDSSAMHVLLWEARIPPPAESTLRLNLPTALHAVQTDDFAVIASDPGWITAVEPGISPDTLPEGLRQQLTEWNEGVERVSRMADNGLVLHRVDRPLPDGLSSVVLTEHQLRGTADGGWQGQSDFHPQPKAGTIEIFVPAGLEILSILVDGQALPLDQVSATERRWRIRNAGQHRSLMLRWQAAPASWRLPVAGMSQIPLPRSVQERPTTTLLTLTPAGDSWLTGWHALPRRQRWELDIERLEWLLQRRQQREASDPEVGLSQVIWSEYRSAAASLPMSQASGRWTDESRRRWEAITEAVRRIDDGPERRESSTGESSDSVQTVNDERSAYSITSRELPAYRLGMVRRDAVNWISSVILFGVCWRLLPRLIRLQFVPWLSERRHAGWFVFGAAWWLCFSPGIIGIALMAWAVLDGVWRRRLQGATAQ